MLMGWLRNHYKSKLAIYNSYFSAYSAKVNVTTIIMNSLVFLAAFVAVSQASVIPWGGVVVQGPSVGPSAILQGPSAGATILGPDGGLIKSRIDGGVVLANKGLGLGGTVLSAGVPLLSKGSTVVVAGPEAPGGVIISGPSGTVATGNGIGKSIITPQILTRVVSVPQIISSPIATKVISSDLGLGLGGLGWGGLGLDGSVIGDGRELW